MSDSSRKQISMFRMTGFWLALLIGLFQAINVVRAFFDPFGFAEYMGLPITGLEDVNFVYVYGLRTAFIALLVFALLSLRKFDALSWMALAAVLMPVGDAVLAAKAGAPNVIVIRHAVIGVYIIVAFVFLRRAVKLGAGVKS